VTFSLEDIKTSVKTLLKGQSNMISRSLYIYRHKYKQWRSVTSSIGSVWLFNCPDFIFTSHSFCIIEQEVLGRTNRPLSLIRHGPHRKQRVQQWFYCCVCIRYRGNFSTEPLPSNDRGIFTEPLPSNDKGIFTKQLPSIARGIFLPSHCLATIRGFLPSRCLATIRTFLRSSCLATLGRFFYRAVA
jgi:hypothetical protein